MVMTGILFSETKHLVDSIMKQNIVYIVAHRQCLILKQEVVEMFLTELF